MNSYLLEGSDTLSIKLERDKIIKDNHFMDAPISFYDVEEVPLENALEDLDTYGLFSNQKVIVIQNIESLKQEENKEDILHLLRYISSPNPDNLLILEARKLNNTLKFTKELKKVCKTEEISIDLTKFIEKEFNGYKIDSYTIRFLRDICLDDFSKIQNECSKLKEYKADDKVITKKDIEDIVVPKLGDSKDLTFAFSRSIGQRDKKEALKNYQELLSYDIEPISLVGLLASQIRIIYQVKLLEKDHNSNRKIADLLGEKSDYRIQKTRELTPLYSEEDLLFMMQKLSKMDYQMKSEDVDGFHLIEMFILNL